MIIKPYYEKQWQQFLAAETTLATRDYTWPAWHHKQRKQFFFWGLLPECQVLEQAIQNTHKHLSPYLLEDYQKQTHITLYAAGFLTEEKQYKDDVTWQELQQQVELIQNLNSDCLELKAGALNSFLGAPFIEVIDKAGRLQYIHQALTQQFGSDRDNALIPHITLGLYKNNFSTRIIENKFLAIEAAKQANETNSTEINLSEIEFSCKQVQLISYSSEDIRSPLIAVDLAKK